jgi:hypothetical protein
MPSRRTNEAWTFRIRLILLAYLIQFFSRSNVVHSQSPFDRKYCITLSQKEVNTMTHKAKKLGYYVTVGCELD